MSSRNRKHTHYVYDGNGGNVTPNVQSTDYLWSIINSPWESTADKQLYSFILLSTNSLPTPLSFWWLFVVTTDGENPVWQTWDWSKITRTCDLNLHYCLTKNGVESSYIFESLSTLYSSTNQPSSIRCTSPLDYPQQRVTLSTTT